MSDGPRPAARDPREQRELRAGPLRCVLEDGALRWITVRLADGTERELVRGIYAAVRDHNWATPAPGFTRYEVEDGGDSFRVRFTAEHVAGEIDLVWQGEIDGGADGSISFSVDAVARSSFLRNRLGFCVLHPMEVAGGEVEVEHSDGSRELGVFPAEISAHQPFFEIAALRQSLAGITVEMRFQGDVFEMEDQRNWTDASFKTYCTPLGLPYPVLVPAGARIQQRVVVRTSGDAALPRPLADDVVSALRADEGLRPFEPPAVGLQLPRHGRRMSGEEAELVKRLLPSHLWVTLWLTRAEWERELREAASEAVRVGCQLEIEAICGDSGAGIDGLAARLATDGTSTSAVHVYPTTGVVTTKTVAQRARDAFKAARLKVPLGGGTRADFVNLNRADHAGALPLDLLEFVAFAVNPQVHTFDDASIFETLDAQTVVLENAHRIARGRPVRVGPITLRQRLNPAATGAEPPPQPDPRQATQFCADWTRGSIRSLAGAAALTYYETAGPFGLVDGGTVYPVYGVLLEALGASSASR